MGRGDTQGFDSSSPAACRTPCGRFHKDCLPRVLLHHCGHVSSLGPCMCPGPAGHDHCHRMSGATLAEPVSQSGRGESGWCSDMTSTHGAWRHAGVRFLLSGELRRAMRTCLDGRPPSSPLRCCGAPCSPHSAMPWSTALRTRMAARCRQATSKQSHHRSLGCESFMGRGDTQGFDSSSPASCGVRCACVWMDARRVVHCVAAALLVALTGHDPHCGQHSQNHQGPG